MPSVDSSSRKSTSDEDFVSALPKVELHVHLEGSTPPEAFLILRDKYAANELPGSLEELRRWYAFTDFSHFLDVFSQGVGLLREADDFALITEAVGNNLAQQNVRYAELTMTPVHYLRLGIEASQIFDGIERGRRAVEARHDIEIRWITDTSGNYGPEGGEQTLDAVLSHGPESVVGFGLGGPEVPRKPFRDVFARARRAGLSSIPHAGEAGGEATGAASMWEALDDLEAVRIGHGLAALSEERLTDELRRRDTILELCPTSNLRTVIVESAGAHPLRRMIDAGLRATINSDDPAMFGCTLSSEYLLALQEMGLSRDELITSIGHAVDGSHATLTKRQELRAALNSLQSP